MNITVGIANYGHIRGSSNNRVMKFAFIVCVLSCNILRSIQSLQFGFILSEKNDLFKDNFVSFGEIGESIDEFSKKVMRNDLNDFFRKYRKERVITGINSLKFRNNLNLDFIDKNSQLYHVSLFGDISTFLNLFKLSISSAKSSHWSKVIFFPYPVVTMTRTAFAKASSNVDIYLTYSRFEDDLNQYAVPNTDDGGVDDFLKDLNFDESESDDSFETITFEYNSPKNRLKDRLIKSGSKNCFKCCTIS